MVIALVGNVEPQTGAVKDVLSESYIVLHVFDPAGLEVIETVQPDLIVVAGWRHIIPPRILAIAPTVGFHSARLPEYPGRAPVPWTLLRGDPYAYNTLFYLDEGIDTGDVIAEDRIEVEPGETPDSLYAKMATSCRRLLRLHLPSILNGSAPRYPQDPNRRGPLTTKDGWDLWRAR